MKAKKTFIDGKGKRVNFGDTINEKDYTKNIWESYKKRGLIGPDEKKPAAPKNKKGGKK